MVNIGGFFSDDNTWEPEENLDCPDLISEFNKKKDAEKRPPEKKRKPSHDERKSNTPVSKRINDEKPRGFSKELSPEKIIGATDSSGALMFLMKWFDLDCF